MADHKNQHYVPKFYFRNFSEDKVTICTLLTKNGRTIHRCPIKFQCSKVNFYGSKEIESLLSSFEVRHSNAMHAARDVANNSQSEDLSAEEYHDLLEAIIFQRFRTALEVEKSSEAMCAMSLAAFRHHLKHSDHERKDEMVNHIDLGNITVTESSQSTILRKLQISMGSAVGISDLQLCLLRNCTDYPFIFSDAPVVFYNSYCRQVRNRGVLGLQCPGLLIFFPLDSQTAVFLYDSDRYRTQFGEYLEFDITERKDVSNLNALQLHHSSNAVYFSDWSHEPYLYDLWANHRPTMRPIKDIFVSNANFLVDGQKPSGPLMQILQQQVNFNLDLSFITCSPISQQDYVYSPRSKRIREILRKHERMSEES